MYNYKNDEEYNKIQHWAMIHQPNNNEIYHERFWKCIVFIRDMILKLYYKDIFDAQSCIEDAYAHMSLQYDIIGTYKSYNILIPVLELRYKNAYIVFSNDLNDWEITVISPIDLDIPDSLLVNRVRFDYFGFPEKYRLNITYKYNTSHFSVLINNDYSMYAFLVILKMQLDKKFNDQ